MEKPVTEEQACTVLHTLISNKELPLELIGEAGTHTQQTVWIGVQLGKATKLRTHATQKLIQAALRVLGAAGNNVEEILMSIKDPEKSTRTNREDALNPKNMGRFNEAKMRVRERRQALASQIFNALDSSEGK